MSGIFGMGSSSEASAPSKINDSRAVGYDNALNITGSKNKVWSNRDQASQFAGAGQSNITGDGNTTSFNVLDGGAIGLSFDFAKAALDASHNEIARFAQQAGQFLSKGADVAAVESSPEAAGMEKLRLLLWPAVALLAFWIWKKGK